MQHCLRVHLLPPVAAGPAEAAELAEAVEPAAPADELVEPAEFDRNHFHMTVGPPGPVACILPAEQQMPAPAAAGTSADMLQVAAAGTSAHNSSFYSKVGRPAIANSQ